MLKLEKVILDYLRIKYNISIKDVVIKELGSELKNEHLWVAVVLTNGESYWIRNKHLEQHLYRLRESKLKRILKDDN